MWFQISTPQSVGAHIAMQEARKASKRKSAHGSVMEPSTKKQKHLHDSLPPAPAQSQTHASLYLRPPDKRPKPVDASLPQAQAQIQAHELTNLGPSTKKRKADYRSIAPARSHDVVDHEMATQISELDHGSLPPAQAPAPAQAHDITDLGPATKKQKLSYASLPPARARPSSEDRARSDVKFYRRFLGRWCKSHGFDNSLIDESRLPDTFLLSPNFDMHKFMDIHSSGVPSCAYGPQEPDVCPSDVSSAENLMAESQKEDTHRFPGQNFRDDSYDSPAPDTVAQVCPVSGGVSVHNPPAQFPISREHAGSGDKSSDPPQIQSTTVKASLALGGKSNEVCPLLGDHSSTSLPSINSTLEIPGCSSSNSNKGYNSTPMTSGQIASVGLDRDIGDRNPNASSDQNAPLFLNTGLRNETTLASSSQTASVGPPRNKGGRPRSGRKQRARKNPKGPTRFQKNHPVKAMVDVYVWENILVFCPPDFLLKARSISSTFRSVLKDDSPIWKKARLNHFGPDMPDPPLGLSEPQYADLVTGTGCQTRGCTSTKTRKTYWALQKRLCIECFEKSFLPVSILV